MKAEDIVSFFSVQAIIQSYRWESGLVGRGTSFQTSAGLEYIKETHLNIHNILKNINAVVLFVKKIPELPQMCICLHM